MSRKVSARSALLPLLALAAAVAGCGGEGDSRARVRAYLKSVNAIERGAAPDVKRANETYRRFAERKLKPDDAAAQMRQIDGRIRAVRDRVVALRVPKEANTLHARLAAFYGRILDLTRETALLAAYLADSDAALAPVTGINRDLRLALRRAPGPIRQARALDGFARRIDQVIADLRALRPPRVLRVPNSDQIRRLGHTRRVAVALRSALRQGDAARVERLLDRFGDAPEPRDALAARAIRDYEDHYRALSSARSDVRREYGRLDRVLR